jgi:heme-degrading monooxygenase HmoA
LVLWEFFVRPENQREFECLYGADGDWAQCFRQGAGYLGTELVRDLKNARRYVTVDRWESREAYEVFKSSHASAYKMLDERCERLTEREAEIGAFQRCPVEDR